MSDERVENNQVFQQPPQPQQPQNQLHSLSQETGFEIPVESVVLPSKGLVYTVDSPLCNQVSVDIKSMTAREEDLLTSAGLIKNGTVISKLLESCLINKSVNADDMLIGDRNAVLIAIRITGYGSSYKVKVSCPECDEVFENEFSLSGLAVKPLGVAPVVPNNNLFAYTLPSGAEVQFKLLTGKDEAEISLAEKRNKKIGRQVESGITNRLFYSILSINGETDRGKLQRQIVNMPVREARALRNYIDSVEPGVEMKQEAECKHCGELTEVRVPLGLSFFWPDLD